MIKMNQGLTFVNLRQGHDRRFDCDPCSSIPMDLFHRKRRKSPERRKKDRSLADDYHAFMNKYAALIRHNRTFKANLPKGEQNS
ncbi:MAG: hypothetical protein COA42_08785 [Alteromonadaceae bacterium]|nr:MAG: hypothetical protein COA42_08785 [Alteromonadaceae bacterium]